MLDLAETLLNCDVWLLLLVLVMLSGVWTPVLVGSALVAAVSIMSVCSFALLP
jgi:hypothetical protein